MYNLLSGIIRALGDSKHPVQFLIIASIVNIGLDLLFIIPLHMGITGAALATVISQGLAGVMCLVFIIRKIEILQLSKEDWQLDGSHFLILLNMGLPMGLQYSITAIGSVILQTAINGLGNSYIVAQSAARRITEILMSVFVAIGHTMATYCSQNLGADRWDRIHEGMKAGYWITCLWCVLVLVIVYTLAPTLICMITGSSDQVMIRAATQYLRIDNILYVLVAVIFVQRNSMQGIGDTVTPLISSGIEMAGKIILAFTLVPALGYFGVILVEPIEWIVMIIPLILKVRTWER
jgi:Na+-driven multidrug efflux pump